MLKLCLENNADLNIKNKYDETPFYRLIIHKKNNLIEYLCGNNYINIKKTN